MAVTVPIGLGTVPKRRIVELAFGECGMTGYEFGRTPEEVADALVRLDAMMAQWESEGILLGYVFTDYGSGDPDDLSGIPRSTLNAVSTQLAWRLAPMIGKTMAPEVYANMARAMTLLRAQYATIPNMPRHNAPRGAGNRRLWFGPFINEVIADPVIVDPALPAIP